MEAGDQATGGVTFTVRGLQTPDGEGPDGVELF